MATKKTDDLNESTKDQEKLDDAQDAMAAAGLTISYEDNDQQVDDSKETESNVEKLTKTEMSESDEEEKESENILDSVLDSPEFDENQETVSTPNISSKSSDNKEDENLIVKTSDKKPEVSEAKEETSNNTFDDFDLDDQKMDNNEVDSGFSDFRDVPDTNIIIKFIDQTTNNSRIKTLMGQPSSTADYTTANDIQQHINAGYEIIKDETGGKQPVFGKENKTYSVLMKHKLEKVSRSKVVTETIEYSMSDDTIAPDDHVNTLEFEQEGSKDLVTDRITWNAKPIKKTFPEVKSPTIKGYKCDTPVVKPIDVVLSTDTFNTDLDIKRTINYIAEQQVIVLKFVDKTSHITRTKTLHGSTNKHSGYYATDTIDQFLNHGYDLLKDDTNGQELIYDDQTGQNQVYTIELKHKIKRLTPDDSYNDIKNRDEHDNLIHIVKRDIIFRTPSLLPDIDPISQSAEFTRDAILDLVTGHVEYGDWSDSTTLEEVIPDKIKGYKPTPEKVPEIKVSYNSKNQTIHVGYTAEPKKIKVIYYDTVLNKPYKTRVLQGKSDENSHYLTADMIKECRKKGYSIINDPTNGDELIFDRDQDNQTVAIELGHLTRKVDSEHAINPVNHKDLTRELIKYVTRHINFDTPLSVKSVKPVSQTLKFIRTGETDLITGETKYNDFTEAKDFESVEVPEITGYEATLDGETIDKVPEKSITGEQDSYDVKVVYKPELQTVDLVIFDEDADKEIVNKKLQGYTNEVIKFNKRQLLLNLKNKHFKVIADDFNIKTYPTKSPVECKITVKHEHAKLTVDKSHNPISGFDEINQLTKTENYEIKYLYHTGKEAAKPIHVTLSSKRDGDLDLVSGDIKFGRWVETTKMADKVSPTIEGFTPSQKVVTQDDLVNNDSPVIEINYFANYQVIVFNFYCDQKLVKKAPAKIGLNDKKAHPVHKLVKEVTDLGYGIDANQNYPDVVKYDPTLSDTRKYNINVHETFDTSTDTKDVTRTITITMPDNSMRTIIQTATLKRTLTTSNVTKKVSYGIWNQSLWDAIIPAKVNNLEPSITKLSEKTVTSNTKSETINITYRKPKDPEPEVKPAQTPVKRKQEKKPSFFNRLFHRNVNDSNNNDQKALPAPDYSQNN